MKYVALLHAINLGAKRKVNMAELRGLLGDLGLSGVQTYIQSGNALFETSEAERDLKPRLELALAERFGFGIPVTLRTAPEWAQAIDDCPAELHSEKVSVAFLAALPTANAVDHLKGRDVAPERWEVVGRHLYQTVPEGTKNLRLSLAVIERVLGVAGTVRNWNTTQKIGELLRS